MHGGWNGKRTAAIVIECLLQIFAETISHSIVNRNVVDENGEEDPAIHLVRIAQPAGDLGPDPIERPLDRAGLGIVEILRRAGLGAARGLPPDRLRYADP